MKRAGAVVALWLLTACSTGGRPVALNGCNGKPLPLLSFDATAPRTTGTVAVLLTGDGGWRAIDRDISGVLRAEGMPVIGFLSNDYFANTRSREETECDVARLVDESLRRTGATDLLLIGFSRGADTLAFTVPRLSQDVRRHVRLVAILGPATTASLKVDHWWNRHKAATFPLDPRAIAQAAPLLCISGTQEKDSLCRSITAPGTAISWRGGHHFGGDYREIARAILARAGAASPLHTTRSSGTTP